MPKIDYNGALNCTLTVGSLDAAIDWYERVLGFKVRARMDQIHFAVMETGVPGVVLGLGEGEATGSGSTELTWGVSDIEAAEAAFKASGGQPHGPISAIPGVVRLLSFSDPDGNKHQFWAPPRA